MVLMGELLTRLSKLHSVFSDHLFADITLSDIGDALRSVLDANICLCTPEGELLYTHECARFSCGHAQQRMSDAQKLSGFLKERVRALLAYQLNVPFTAHPCLFESDVLCRQHDAFFSFFPVYGDRAYLCCLVIWKTGGQRLESDEAVLCESAAAMTCMVASRARNKSVTRDQIYLTAARTAVNVLSYSELNAIKELVKVMTDGECTLVVNELASKIFITRSVISNALRKLESAEIIRVKSMGVKGTYIRIINSYLSDVLAEDDKDADYSKTGFSLRELGDPV